MEELEANEDVEALDIAALGASGRGRRLGGFFTGLSRLAVGAVLAAARELDLEPDPELPRAVVFLAEDRSSLVGRIGDLDMSVVILARFLG